MRGFWLRFLEEVVDETDPAVLKRQKQEVSRQEQAAFPAVILKQATGT